MMRVLLFPILALSLAHLPACEGGASDGSGLHEPDTDAGRLPDGDDTVQGDAPDGADGWDVGGDSRGDGDAPDGDGEGAGVVEHVDLERTYDCGASECLAPYFDFPDEFAEHARPVSAEELEEQLAAARDAPEPEPTGLQGEALREAVLDALNIGFLVDGWLADLVVTRIREEDHRTYTERELLLEDPAIGTVEALLFVPRGAEEPLPAMVGLHGHGETKDVFVDAYMGRRLAEAGFVVLVPTLRVHDCSADENAVATHLLRNGFTLMGLRAYEALLMARYLKAQPWVAPDRIGLYSHSGGSSTANLVVRISGDFAAQVTDYVQDYRNTCGPDDIHCETMPAMFPLSADVNDPSTLPIPRMKVPYAFKEPALRDDIEAFFEEHLR